MYRLRAASGVAVVLAIAGNGFAPALGSAPSALVGGLDTYTVSRGDTLTAIGARHGVDPATLSADNHLPPSLHLAPGRVLLVDTRHVIPAPVDARSIIVNVPQRMLFFGGDEGLVTAYPVAVGRQGWSTPVGPFEVLTAERNPTWDVPQSILEEARQKGRELPRAIPPGPDNPLGAFWLGLSLTGVGIHGTNAPASIYRAATHGCIRMHPDDIAALFERVTVGARGRTLYAPVLLAVEGGRVYVEVHPDIYGRAPSSPLETLRALADARGVAERVDWPLVKDVVAARHGVARDVTAADESAHRLPSAAPPSWH
jgi:L,D-transpeptidase ErfK/SrfK